MHKGNWPPAHFHDALLSNSNCTQCLYLSAWHQLLPPGPDSIEKTPPATTSLCHIAFLSKKTFLSTSLSNITFLSVFWALFCVLFPLSVFWVLCWALFWVLFSLSTFLSAFLSTTNTTQGTSEPYSSVHTRCFWSQSWVCEVLFGEVPFQYNHHGWWTLLESDWRRNGVCNVLICLVTPRKSRGNKLTQGWENSYVPCHTTVPLFLSSPCSFLVLFAYLHLWYFCLAFDCFWSPLFIELKNRLW